MIGFFFCAFHTDISNHILNFEKYIDASACYILSMETATNSHALHQGQHIHICADMSIKQYDRFRKTYLVKTLKLSGQARDGHGLQYGKIRNIRDETRLAQYTVKDTNIYYRNYDLETIQQLILNSFKKKDKKDFITELMEHLLTLTFNREDPNGLLRLEIIEIEIAIIKYYIAQKINKPISKSQIKSLTTRYLMYFHKNTEIEKIYYYVML